MMVQRIVFLLTHHNSLNQAGLKMVSVKQEIASQVVASPGAGDSGGTRQREKDKRVRRSKRVSKKRAASPDAGRQDKRIVPSCRQEEGDFEQAMLKRIETMTTLQAEAVEELRQMRKEMGKERTSSMAEAAKVIADVFMSLTRKALTEEIGSLLPSHRIE